VDFVASRVAVPMEAPVARFTNVSDAFLTSPADPSEGSQTCVSSRTVALVHVEQPVLTVVGPVYAVSASSCLMATVVERLAMVKFGSILTHSTEVSLDPGRNCHAGDVSSNGTVRMASNRPVVEFNAKG